MEKYCIWDNGSVLHKDQPRKIYVGQWPIFHGPLILPYILSYTWIIFIFQELALAVGIRAPTGTCSSG